MKCYRPNCRRKGIVTADFDGNMYCEHCARKQSKKARKRAWQARHPKNYKSKKKTVTNRIMLLRKKATWAERKFKDKMKVACPVAWKFQRGFIKGKYYAIVDFYVPSRRLCIEIDGKYHEDPKQKAKDTYRDKWLVEKRNQRVVRLTNNEAEKMTVVELRALLDRYVRSNL